MPLPSSRKTVPLISSTIPIGKKQKGCVLYIKHFEFEEIEGDNIDLAFQSETNSANCQIVCKTDKRRKAGK
jgi:hypothetical protein